MRRLLIPLFVTLLAIVGCGGDDDEESSSATTAVTDDDPRSEADLAADETAAADALLTLDDFPDGWTSKPRDDSTPEAPDLELAFAECLDVDPALLADAEVKAKSDTFIDANAEVEASVSMQPTEDKADKGVAILEKEAVPACFEEALSGLMQRLVDDPKPGAELPEGFEMGGLTVSDRDLPTFGEFSRALRAEVEVSATDINTTLYVDLLFIRVGRATTSMSFQDVGTPFDEDLEVELATTFTSKLPTT